MDQLSGASLSPSATYSSSNILQRRRRILKETRAMIAEHGIENFSIRQLCQRADVAQRTLYNAFGGKDRMIAIAIQEAFYDVHNHTCFRTAIDTLDGVLNRLIEVNRRNFKARNYTKAITAIYFATGTHKDIWDALQVMAISAVKDWFAKMETAGHFQEWVVPADFASDLANFEYSIINDWACGRIRDEDYLLRLAKGVLQMTMGVTRGPEQDAAATRLLQIHATGELPRFPAPVGVPAVQPGTGNGQGR